MMNNIIYILILFSISFSLENSFTQRTIADSLPKNMPLIKKVFWGERGLFRETLIDPKSRMKELKIRRNMLQLHQRFALFTLGAMMYQYNIGNKLINNDGTPSELKKYKDLHMNLGYFTFGTYSITASLSIFSPPGMKYTNKKLSSNRLHRYLALVHFTGMMIQPWLGYYSSVAGLEGRPEDREDLLELHETIGGITLSTYFIAFLTTLFK